MNRSARKPLTVLLAMLLFFVSCLSVSVNAEQTYDYNEDGKMDLDVVFVLDASSSMLSSDPDRIAIDAFNLFTDLCDESCSVGYSVYTEKLKASSPIVSLDNKKNLEKLKKDISDIEYDPYGSTDIALGLTKAMNIHAQNKNADSNRKKVIILLSDGNTYLENGPRTLAEANKEMNSTLNTLKSKNIPVYSIGLNYDGTLDKKELQKISKSTNGKSYETTTSDKLITIISDIFSDIYKLNGTNCEIKDGNVKINVKDNSVFYVNVIIKSKFSKKELNPVLTSPDGKEVLLTNNNNIKLTSTGSYTLIKLIYPDSGTWNLHLDNANSDNCTITQLDFYSIYIKQKINKTATVGDSVKIEASLNDMNGVVDDCDLLTTIEMTTVVSGKDGDKEISLIRQNDGIYTGEFTVDSEGEYTVKTTATSKTFSKESTTAKINVKLKPEESIISEPSTPESDTNDDMSIFTIIITIISIVIVSLLLTIIIVVIARAIIKSKTEYVKEEPAPQPTKPQPQPTKPIPPAPKPKEPDYVDIPLIEHGSLESLIKKGPEDAFNTKASDYKADENLEKLIKSGESGLSDNVQNNTNINKTEQSPDKVNLNKTSQPSDKVNLNKNTNNNS